MARPHFLSGQPAEVDGKAFMALNEASVKPLSGGSWTLGKVCISAHHFCHGLGGEPLPPPAAGCSHLLFLLMPGLGKCCKLLDLGQSGGFLCKLLTEKCPLPFRSVERLKIST